MPTPTDNAVPLTGNSLVDGLIQGSRWEFTGGTRVLTYSFSLNDTPIGGSWTFRSDMAAQVRAALGAWASVANLSFTESGSGTVFTSSPADLAITLTGNDLQREFGAVGLGLFPSPSFAGGVRDAGYTVAEYSRPEGDIFFDNFHRDYNNVTTGRIGYYYLLHEIGHALGLKHTGDDGGNGRPTFSQLGINAMDTTNDTIMSGNLPQGTSNSSSFNPTTPMILDILAIQQLYGANMSYRTGDDVYVLDRMTKTIWDAGGFDVLDASTADIRVEIDLQPGNFSTPGSLTGSNSWGAGPARTAIAYGVSIEKAIGSRFDDLLRGSDGPNILDGGQGADTMHGRGGDDEYRVDVAGDVVSESPDEGTDTVVTGINYTLTSNVENLTLTGTTGLSGNGNGLDNSLTGSSGSNTLTGGAGNDRLWGAAGRDTLKGGSGDDVYLVDEAAPATFLSLQGGAGAYVVGDRTVIYAATVNLSPVVADWSGDGVPDSVLLTADDGVNRYNLYVSTKQLGQGLTVGTYLNAERASFASGHAGLDLFGNGAGVNQVFGSFTINAVSIGGTAGNWTLDRFSVDFEFHGESAGATAVFGSFNYNYASPAVTWDTIVELPGEGADRVESSVTCNLQPELENLTLTGALNIDGTGNAADNVIRGNSGNNVLDGGVGNDTMSGGGGNDTFMVDSTLDRVSENPGEGVDTVMSSVSYTIVNVNVENLTLTGSSPVVGTGNGGNNTLTGNSADNVLTGGAGDDLYLIQSTGDTVVELPGEGIDRVESPVAYALPANVENLTLTGVGDVNATGNALGNRLVGNGGVNTLSGGDGDDVYVVQNAGDIVVELPGQGRDRIETPFTTTLAVNFENLTLTGTDNVDGTGNASDNVLLGNAGINVLTGGLGDDIYGVDNAADMVIENAGGGIDLVVSSVSYTLPANVESLTLRGDGNFDGTGNALDNRIAGTRGNNVLTGGGGSDMFIGGAGYDTVVLDRAKDDYTLRYAGGKVTLVSGPYTAVAASSVDHGSVGMSLESRTDTVILSGVESIRFSDGLTRNVGTYYLEAQRDADGDGKADIYWRNSEDGRVSAWLMDGLSLRQGEVFSNVPLDWQIQDSCDLDGDGKSDLLWRNVNDGRVSTWLMDGLTVKQGEVFGNVPLEWKIQGTADFDGDGKSDLLWRNVSDGRVSAWLMDGLTVVQGDVFSNVPLEWEIQKTGDFNGDGSGDILWRNVNDGRVSAWLMSGLNVTRGAVFSDVPLEWKVQETGDLDADGHTDILWRNAKTGQVSAWLMDGLQVKQGAVFSDVPLEWQIQGMGDFNNDLHADILWRNTDGRVSQWLMEGLDVLRGSVFSEVPTAWVIV